MTKRSPRVAVWVPKSEDDLDAAIAKVTDGLRAVDAINADAGRLLAQLTPIKDLLDEQIQRIQAGQLADIAGHSEAIDDLLAGILAYVEPNWGKLGTSKTLIQRAVGVIRRRKDSKPSIVIVDEETVLQRLKDLGLTRFIRTKEEVNRAAMQLELGVIEGIEGVTVVRDETLTVHPKGGRKVSAKFSALRKRLKK